MFFFLPQKKREKKTDRRISNNGNIIIIIRPRAVLLPLAGRVFVHNTRPKSIVDTFVWLASMLRIIFSAAPTTSLSIPLYSRREQFFMVGHSNFLSLSSVLLSHRARRNGEMRQFKIMNNSQWLTQATARNYWRGISESPASVEKMLSLPASWEFWHHDGCSAWRLIKSRALTAEEVEGKSSRSLINNFWGRTRVWLEIGGEDNEISSIFLH